MQDVILVSIHTRFKKIKLQMKRADGRSLNEPRSVTIEPNFMPYAEGSALIAVGDTQVICTATVDERVPRWIRGSGRGWVTAEYAMLPRSTVERVDRRRSTSGGRSQEIQRLIGRSLRSVTDLDALGERSIVVDCDVLRADGGTRTASITGAYVALELAIKKIHRANRIQAWPLLDRVSAVSVGILDGECVLDLPYEEDSRAEVDMNVVLSGDGRIVEVQATAEGSPFTSAQMNAMLELAQLGCQTMNAAQKVALEQRAA